MKLPGRKTGKGKKKRKFRRQEKLKKENKEEIWKMIDLDGTGWVVWIGLEQIELFKHKNSVAEDRPVEIS